MGRLITESTTASDTTFQGEVFPKTATNTDTKEPKKNEAKKSVSSYTTTQKVLITLGVTAVIYYILHKAGSLK